MTDTARGKSPASEKQPKRAKAGTAASAKKRAVAEKPKAPARPDAVLQRRGVERVEAILDAAEQILAEQGYEAATLKAVGERAGIPTASVYHYFSDRFQVDAQIMQRHVEGVEQQITNALENSTSWQSIGDAVNAVIDPMLAYFRAHRSSVELWFSSRDEAVASLVAAFDASTAERLWQVALERGLLREDTPLLVLQLAFTAGNSLFDAAFQRVPGSGDDVVIDEARRISAAYLETYAPAR